MNFDLRYCGDSKATADEELKQEISEWVNEARVAGWIDSDTVAEHWWAGDETTWIGCCRSCKRPTACLDLLDPPPTSDTDFRHGHLHGGMGNEYVLCGECEGDEPGHDAYHQDIDDEAYALFGRAAKSNSCARRQARTVPLGKTGVTV